MARKVRLAAMADYASACLWLEDLRSPEGLAQWVKRCRKLGLSRLFFRVSFFGDFIHHTRIENRVDLTLLEDYQDEGKRKAWRKTVEFLNAFDVLAGVTREAHRAGIEVVPWITLYDEGVSGKRTTRFAAQHPDLRMKDRAGNRYDRGLSYAHAAVREYRIALIRELAEYGVDGIFLDFTRWLWRSSVSERGVQLVDEHGICQFGYDDPVVEGFRAMTGRDPLAIPNGDTAWVRFRAEATNTALLRGIRKALPTFPVYAYFLPRGFLSEMLLDVPAWIGEGLVDELCPACFSDVPQEGRTGRLTYAIWNDFARQFRGLVATHQGRCSVGAPVLVASAYGPHPDFVGAEPWSFLRPEVMEDVMRSAKEGGADEIIFYDLCQEYNGEYLLWDALRPVCRRVRG